MHYRYWKKTTSSHAGYPRIYSDGNIRSMDVILPSSPELSTYIDSFWFLKSGAASEPYLLPPDPSGTLIFSFDSSTTVTGRGNGGYTVNGHFCTGLRSFPITLTPSGPVDYVAVQLKPHALRSLLGIHPRETADYMVELEAPRYLSRTIERITAASGGLKIRHLCDEKGIYRLGGSCALPRLLRSVSPLRRVRRAGRYVAEEDHPDGG